MYHIPSIIEAFLLLIILSFHPCDLSAKKFYVDPDEGSMDNDGSRLAPWSTLAEVMTTGKIRTREYSPLPYDPQNSQLVVKNPDAPVQAGDTIVLLSGKHGAVEVDRSYNKLPITILAMADETPILSYIQFTACANWILDGVTVDQEPYGYPGLPRGLVFVESHGYRGPSSHITVIHCNIQSGPDGWDWSREEWNELAANGIQSFSINGIVNDSIIIRGNTIINHEDLTHPLAGTLQGIGCFDGPYTRPYGPVPGLADRE